MFGDGVTLIDTTLNYLNSILFIIYIVEYRTDGTNKLKRSSSVTRKKV